MSDPYVFHFALTRSGSSKPVERFATLCIEPEEYGRMGAAAVNAGVEHERRKWQRAIAQLGYGAGWAVNVIRERGYLRSVFPGVALASRPVQAGPAHGVLPGFAPDVDVDARLRAAAAPAPSKPLPVTP